EVVELDPFRHDLARVERPGAIEVQDARVREAQAAASHPGGPRSQERTAPWPRAAEPRGPAPRSTASSPRASAGCGRSRTETGLRGTARRPPPGGAATTDRAR